MLNNKTDSCKLQASIRERLVSKGAAGAGQAIQKMRGAGKPAATSMTIGSGPPPKGVPK